MKTVRQIADEIGVTKQAVFYRIKRPPLSNALQSLTSKKHGVLMVSFDGEKLIKEAFSNDTVKEMPSNKPSKASNKNEVFDAPFDGHTYEVILEQLREKDKLIEKLQNELQNERQHSREKADQLAELSQRLAGLAENAQKLHAADSLPRLIGSHEGAELKQDNNEQTKKGFFSFFRR